MSENLQEKKKLLQEVHEKAKNDSLETSISGVFKYLERILLDDFRFTLNYRTMLGYYEEVVDKDKNKKIKPPILNLYSNYLGFEDFNDYRKNKMMNVISPDGFTTVNVTMDKEHKSFSDTVSSVIVNITNKPIFNIPQLAKNGMGIGAMIFTLFFGLAYGGGGLPNENKYMYWNGERYIGTDSIHVNPEFDVFAMDQNVYKHFKKIKRPDTLTVENAIGKVWYSKCNNKVEFFTMDGVNPENGRELKRVTEHMVNFYAGIK